MTPEPSADHLVSNLLRDAGFRHAFFTRRGGVSEGPYDSLNFSSSVGDSMENVTENLARAARALGVEPQAVYFPSQVHGTGVRLVEPGDSRERVIREEADAVIASGGRLACCVRVADCAPILVGDRRSGAVAAIHAGWRGTVAGVVRAAVNRLRRLIAGDGDLVAAIGPHISLDAFEVSEEVARRLAASSPDPRVVDRSLGPKPHVDLGRILRAQLRAVGLADASIERIGGCTVRDRDVSFSYRRDGERSGRHLAAIVPRR